MKPKYPANAWAVDQCDPDNWMKIPEFDVNPKDVSFEGFGIAIVSPGSGRLLERHENIRQLVKIVRSKIRERFTSLLDVHAAHLRVLDVVFPRSGEQPIASEIDGLSPDDLRASFYVFTMQQLQDAASDFYSAGSRKPAGNAAVQLSYAALWIAQWVNGDANSLARSLQSAAMASSDRGRKAAEALHNKPGGNREKRDAIRATWASGKYSSRDICAEQECAALGMSFSAARKALRNTESPA